MTAAAKTVQGSLSEDLATVLQRVVGVTGLSPAALARRLVELEVFTGLTCVQARLDDAGDAPGEAQASAVVQVIKDAVHRLEQGPTRQALELLLGMGHTRGLLRPARRRAAAQELGISEGHFRRHRELVLLRELAEEICVLDTECATPLATSSLVNRAAITGAVPVPSPPIEPVQRLGRRIPAKTARWGRPCYLILVVAAVIAGGAWIFAAGSGSQAVREVRLLPCSYSQTCYRTPMYRSPRGDPGELVTILTPGTGLYVDCWTTGPIVGADSPNQSDRKINDAFWEKVSWTSSHQQQYSGYVPDYDINTNNDPPSRYWSHCE
jgi:hypothetical protein